MSLKLSIVVPCYNEEEVLHETSRQLLALLAHLRETEKVDASSGVYFVDDGSRDRTWQIIEELAAQHPEIHGIKLSRNQGHQKALLAGLETAPGDALISVDADLQDDISVMEEMVDRYHEGFEIVYGVRAKRESDTRFKRWTAQSYYRVLHFLGVKVVYNHADYRLLSRRALESLRQYEEVNLFLRGIVPLLGYRSTQVTYTRTSRFAGESKYPFGKMLALAIDGITSFSAVPLRLITITGLTIFFGSMLIAAWAFWVRTVGDTAVPGWASTVIPFYFLGGVQLFCIGVMGEYLAKIFEEVKRRPRYFIETTV
ncbi:glycosyltransferase family 2 protein [soil metagenome]